MTAPVSAVIATKDRPEALVRCLGALLGGNVKPRQVVVVDQGSSSAEGEVGAAFGSASDIELHYLTAPEGGVSRARNHGVAAASSDLLAFTDDDCIPAEGWLGALLQACSDEVVGVTGRVLPLSSTRDGLVPTSSRTRTEARLHGPEERAVPWEAGTGGNLLVRRRVIEEIGGFDERFGPGARFKAAEDVEFLYRLLAAGRLVAYTPDAVVYHEMKTRRARLGSRFPYGFGMGAFVASRKGREGEARRLVRPYAQMQFTTFAHGVASRSPRMALEPLLALVGFAAGFASYVATGSASRSTAR